MRCRIPKIFLAFLLLGTLVYSWEDWFGEPLRSYQRSDARLNEVFQLAIQEIRNNEVLPEEEKTRWEAQQREAQRRWIEFRDADADVVEYTWWHGQAMGKATIAWKRRLTEERIQQLRDRYVLKEKDN